MAPWGQFSSSVQAWSRWEVVCVVLTLKWTNVVKPERQVWTLHLKSTLQASVVLWLFGLHFPAVFCLKVVQSTLGLLTCRRVTEHPGGQPHLLVTWPANLEPLLTPLCSTARKSPAIPSLQLCPLPTPGSPCGIPAHDIAPLVHPPCCLCQRHS